MLADCHDRAAIDAQRVRDQACGFLAQLGKRVLREREAAKAGERGLLDCTISEMRFDFVLIGDVET